MKTILLLIAMMLAGCATGSDTMRGAFGTGIEAPENVFHRESARMMMDD
jgi:predicted small secreted protein